MEKITTQNQYKTHSIDYLCCLVFLLVKNVLDLMSNNQNTQFVAVEQT
jgi:hypothetical protein